MSTTDRCKTCSGSGVTGHPGQLAKRGLHLCPDCHGTGIAPESKVDLEHAKALGRALYPAAPEQTEGEVSADPIDAIDATANYKLVHRVKAMLAESHNIPKETDFARGYREALIQLINGEDLPEPAESAPEPQLEGDYEHRVAENVRLVANAIIPGSWLDPATGNKVYNEAALAAAKQSGAIEELKRALYKGYFIPEMEVRAEDRIAELEALQEAK